MLSLKSFHSRMPSLCIYSQRMHNLFKRQTRAGNENTHVPSCARGQVFCVGAPEISNHRPKDNPASLNGQRGGGVGTIKVAESQAQRPELGELTSKY